MLWFLRALWDAFVRSRRTRRERRVHTRIMAAITSEVGLARRERIPLSEFRDAVDHLTSEAPMSRDQVLGLVDDHGLDGASEILGVGQ